MYFSDSVTLDDEAVIWVNTWEKEGTHTLINLGKESVFSSQHEGGKRGG